MKRVIIIIFLLMIILVSYYSFISISMPYQFSLVCDPLFSQEYRQCFQDKLTIFAQQKMSLKDALSHMKSEFLPIKKIDIAYQPKKSIVRIFAHTPLCLINDAFVLTDDKNIVRKDFYSLYTIKDLPQFSIDHHAISDASFIVSRLLNIVPSEIYKAYAIHITDKDNIIFTDKNDSSFTIVSCADMSNVKTMFHLCQKVKKNMNMQKEPNKNNTTLVADTRFAHYIIAYRI